MCPLGLARLADAGNQAARKKLENRRLAYDASITKMQKAKREDFRVEEELRTSKAKYEESSEDVMRRMQDIKDAEADSVADLTRFLDAELDYHERCADELRRVRRTWTAGGPAPAATPSHGGAAAAASRGSSRSRSNTAHSYSERLSRTNSSNPVYEADEPEPEPVRMPIRSNTRVTNGVGAGVATSRPPIGRASTYQGSAASDRAYGSGSGAATPVYGQQTAVPNVGALRANLRPVSRIQTNAGAPNVFADDGDDTASGSGSPDWADRSASPATSYGSLSRSTSAISTPGARKAPPPPPPSRAKKPAPPIPPKREVGY